MRDQWVQFAVVIDEHGGTAGIITPDDVTEEILGRVPESEGPREELYRDAAGRLRVVGTVRLDELSERLGVAIEHEDVETVSGLILALLERPAQVGDLVEYDCVELRVTAVDGRGVAEAAVRELPPQEDRTAE
jgi:CBS domain containing-hemolysin-like protein